MFAGYYEKNFVLQPIENIHEKASRIKYHPVIFSVSIIMHSEDNLNKYGVKKTTG
ncbi:hypothetical protein LTAR_00419 [Leptolinea tardivitalis]|nr:hypothetical protein LTAR_00419 [Leptolinea tardivitalis]